MNFINYSLTAVIILSYINIKERRHLLPLGGGWMGFGMV